MAFLSAAPALLALRNVRVQWGCLNRLDFLWLEITRRCNLACAHCYANSGPELPLAERMRLADWCRVMREARALGCRRVQFIGGEPTLHPHLPELVEHARQIGFSRLEVFTNATLLRDDLVRVFKRRHVLVHFSFYSFDPLVHDRVTGQKGSFDRTVEGIRQLVRRRVRLAAGLIVFPEHAAHVRKTKRFLRRLGVHTIGIDRVRGIGRGEQFVAGATRSASGAAPLGELCGECWKGKLCIAASGDAHPCVFSRDATVGNVFDAGIATIVTGPRLQTFRREMFFGRGGETWHAGRQRS
jgi:MoaA/NifB/PqqE/SkfB family radical SAM enzyme